MHICSMEARSYVSVVRYRTVGRFFEGKTFMNSAVQGRYFINHHNLSREPIDNFQGCNSACKFLLQITYYYYYNSVSMINYVDLMIYTSDLTITEHKRSEGTVADRD